MIHRIGDHHEETPEPVLRAVPDDDPTDEPMYARRFAWEEFIRRSGLPALTKCVAYTLATYGDLNGTDIFPGDDNLAADCGIQKRAVINHRKVLEELGFLTRVADAKPGPGGRAIQFRLSVPRNFDDLEGSRGPHGGPPVRLPR